MAVDRKTRIDRWYEAIRCYVKSERYHSGNQRRSFIEWWVIYRINEDEDVTRGGEAEFKRFLDWYRKRQKREKPYPLGTENTYRSILRAWLEWWGGWGPT